MFVAYIQRQILQSLVFSAVAITLCASVVLIATPAMADPAADNKNLVVPLSRSSLVVLPSPMSEVMVADPAIADVHAHNATHLTIVGKRLGRTTVRVFDKEGNLSREFEVMVGHDLPAIRKALKNFLPDEAIGVEMVNTSVALTGKISSAAVADKAIKIVTDFIATHSDKTSGAEQTQNNATTASENMDILNLMQITSGQQVMLRVRVGEIKREALKTLGVDLNYLSGVAGTGVGFGTGSGIGGLVANSSGVFTSPGVFTFNEFPPADTRGVLTGRYQPNGRNGNTVAGLIQALEEDGLFKLLAEPNLVAVTGEEAEFLAGGEIPIPVVQGTTGATNNVTIQYKPFGVGVRFTPYVLSDSRIRMQVQPEVSEISTENNVEVSGFSIPSISTRRAKTTVELAPGESFMIAGLIKDDMRATIEQLPGAKELPVLGALFRSTEFQRNETELVIAVTPYLVDPMKSSDMKLPTDRFRPSSQMELFFFGALGSLSGSQPMSQSPGLEGPVGFMVD